MANVTVAGASYTDVPAVDLPKTGGGNVRFYEPSEIKYAASHTSGGAAELTVAIPYGEVDGTSTSTAYTVTVPGVHELKDGVVCYIRNDVVTSTTNFTLDVNGLGAKPVYQNSADATRIATTFSSAVTWLFIYNENRVAGGCWDAYYGYVNSNTIGYQVRTNSMKLPASDKFYRYRLLFQSADGQKFVPANTSTSTNATASRTTNTRPIDPFGLIVYYGSTTAISAGSSPGATVLWQQYVVTLGYSFNNTGAALTLTANDPVYLRCTPNADGSAVMDYFTQTLPSTEDGKIYIFLGVAVDATTVELNISHPVYYYKGSAIRLWTNAPTQSGPSPSDATPQALGTAAAGSSADYSRADHVHAKPSYSAGDVGAIAAPASPSVGDFLVYTNNGWDAMTLSTWQGGSY